MKQRNGFVSNSSSSSFILAVRNFHEVGEVDGGVFVMLAKELTRFLQGRRLVTYEQIEHDKLIDEWGNDYASSTDEWYLGEMAETKASLAGRVKDLIGPDERIDDWRFHRGYVSNDDGEIVSQMLYEEQVQIRTENVRLG